MNHVIHPASHCLKVKFESERAKQGQNIVAVKQMNPEIISQLASFRTIDQLRRSSVYQEHKSDILRLFREPYVYRRQGCRPKLTSFIRVVQWNILYGAQLSGIIDALTNHPILKYGDVLLLNEVDSATSRAHGRDIAAEISSAIGAHAIYGVEYLELADAASSGTNGGSPPLHGNAILTRYPFSNERVIRLPRCEDNYASTQKRLGGRAGVISDLDIGGRKLTVATAHLDVVNTPRCRQVQLRALLEAVGPAGSNSAPALIGGDFNTHTFVRGSRKGALRNLSRLMFQDVNKLNNLLLDPISGEPALVELSRFGFETAGFNDSQSTNRVMLEELDRTSSLPRMIKSKVIRRLQPLGPALEFRLDWIAGKGVEALTEGTMIDAANGIASISAVTLQGLNYKGVPLSDHDPIVVDIALE